MRRRRLSGSRKRLRQARDLAFGAAIVALLAAGAIFLLGGSDPDPTETATAETVAGEELPGLPWEAEPAGTQDPGAKFRAPEKNGVAIGGADAMPPASAGNNGSYTPTPADERERMLAETHDAGQAGQSVLLGDSALAPANAPAVVKEVISAANQITHLPYEWGGGHGSWSDNGYDCSGAVSYALAGGGLLNRPATSGELATWGKPGPGDWITLYANGGHVYAVIAGLRFDTVGNQNGSGPRWHPAPAYPAGYEMRHLPGL